MQQQKIKITCNKCKKYGIETEMKKRELDIKEVKNKMKYGKIEGYPYFWVYLLFNYFECPICHFYKFVNKRPKLSLNIEGYNHE